MDRQINTTRIIAIQRQMIQSPFGELIFIISQFAAQMNDDIFGIFVHFVKISNDLISILNDLFWNLLSYHQFSLEKIHSSLCKYV